MDLYIEHNNVDIEKYGVAEKVCTMDRYCGS